VSRAPGAATFRTPAEAYDRHIGRYGPSLAAALIGVASVRAGERVLDVGCGPGALTSALAAVVGAERVAAIEPSEPFAAACRARVPGARVEVGAAEALPFGDGEFDHALAQLVVNFMADPEQGVREMARVAGRVSAAVWDYAGEMTILRAFWDAAVALDPAAEALDEGRTMPHCTPDELAELWRDAGLGSIHTSAAVASASYAGFEDLWGPLETGVAPSGAYVAGLPSERRAELKAAFRERLGVGEAPFSLDARAWVVTGLASAGAV
jgi:SAM-dependent methyltransferase